MIAIQRIGAHELPKPARHTKGSAGYDLCSASVAMGGKPTAHMIYPGQIISITTGFAWAIPEGFVGLVRPRSGLARKQGIHVMAGVIDSDYTGELSVVLVNLGEKPVSIRYGDRIAQLVITVHRTDELVEVESLEGTERGSEGFGSTGM